MFFKKIYDWLYFLLYGYIRTKIIRTTHIYIYIHTYIYNAYTNIYEYVTHKLISLMAIQPSWFIQCQTFPVEE